MPEKFPFTIYPLLGIMIIVMVIIIVIVIVTFHFIVILNPHPQLSSHHYCRKVSPPDYLPSLSPLSPCPLRGGLFPELWPGGN